MNSQGYGVSHLVYKISKVYSLISICTNFKASACHALMFGGLKDEVSGLFPCSVQVWRDIVTQQKELSCSALDSDFHLLVLYFIICKIEVIISDFMLYN